MVRVVIFFFLLFAFVEADTPKTASEDLLMQKIRTFVDPVVFTKDRAYIDIIFSPRSNYYTQKGEVNSVKIIRTLKENGLLKLFFQKPRTINITFQTEGAPLFFIKIMSDTLRNIGYYRYATAESSMHSTRFSWKINFVSEYAADPSVLSQELKKSNCRIVDIVRESQTDWSYVIDMKNARLNVDILEGGEEFRLKRSLYSYWLDVSKVDKIEILSSARNDWYPYIAYYDKSLHLLRVVKIDKKRRRITLNMRENTHYIKISDIYTLKNIKDDLILKPSVKRINKL